MFNLLIDYNYKLLKKLKLKPIPMDNLKKKVRLKTIFIVMFEVLLLVAVFTVILISISAIIDIVSIKENGQTENEFINGTRLNIFESFAQTIEQSFTGTAPSLVYQPLLTHQLLDNFPNTIWFLLFSMILSVVLSILHIFFKAVTPNGMVKKIGGRIIYLNMVLPGATLLILVSAFTIPLNGNSLFDFDINNPVDWLMPVCLASFPLSTFLSIRIWGLYVIWTISLDKKLFSGMKKKRRWTYFKVFFKLHWYDIFTIMLFMFMSLIMFEGLIEYVIDFPGIGSFFINSLKKNDIWVIEPIVCWFCYLLFATIFILNINRWIWLNSTIWRRITSE